MDRRDQVDVLNDLLHKSYDAEKGYKEAAENVESPHLKELFRKYSSQRSSFGTELKSMIISLGGEVDKGDTIAAKMHRAWMDLKSALASNEEKNILEEVKRGESNALSHYEEALEELDSTSMAYDTVARQRNQIREAIAKAESLLPTYDKDRKESFEKVDTNDRSVFY
jgi:uncharacterized protein (TIGR02284 family)